MTVRVAELEAVFTANADDFDAKAKAVEARTDALDGTSSQVDVVADTVAALDGIDAVAADLRGIDGDGAQVQVDADTAAALDDLDAVTDGLGDVDGETAGVEVEADVTAATDDLEKVADGLADVDGEKVTAKVDVDAKGASDGLDKASEGLDEFKDEAAGTAREGAASFTGEFDDVSDILQETLANAFVGFGPAGAAAGLLAAGGLGIVLSQATKVSEEVNAAAEATNALAGEIVDAGGSIESVDFTSHFREWADEITNVRSVWEFWQDDAVSQLDEVRQAAADAGIDINDLLSAMASGDAGAASALMGDYRDRLSELKPELDDLIRRQDAYGQYIAGNGPKVDALSAAENRHLQSLQAERDGLEQVTGELDEQVDSLRSAEDRADRMAAATEGVTLQQYQLQQSLDEANEAMNTAGSEAREAAEEELNLRDAVKDTTATVRDSEASQTDKRRALLDLAGQITKTAGAEEKAKGTTKAYNRVIEDNRDKFIRAARAAGSNKKEAEKLAREYGLMPKVVETDLRANGKNARRNGRAVRRWLNDLHATIDVTANTNNAITRARAVQRYIDGLNATIQVSGRHVSAGNGYSRSGGITFADGGIHEEDHTAQIAPAGAWRVWAEEETGGEAYIPLSPAKRDRSMAILSEVAGRFGATLSPRADGGLDGPTPFAANARTGSGVGVAVIDRNDMRTFAELVAQATVAASRNTAGAVVAGAASRQDASARYVRGY